EVGQAEQQPLLDLPELPALDLVRLVLVVVLVAKELVAAAEVGGQEGVDEGDVGVEPPDLEDLPAAQAELLVPPAAGLLVVALLPLGPELTLVPPLLDVAEQLDPELVRVEPAGRGGHRARVV